MLSDARARFLMCVAMHGRWIEPLSLIRVNPFRGNFSDEAEGASVSPPVSARDIPNFVTSAATPL